MLKYLNIYSKSDPKLVSEGGVKTRILMLNMNCSRTNETRLAGLQFVCQVKKNWITWKRPTSQDSVFTGAHYHNHSWAPGFHSCSLNQPKRNYCVGRESKPGQLLGRQLCSLLYHRRFWARLLLNTKPNVEQGWTEQTCLFGVLYKAGTSTTISK